MRDKFKKKITWLPHWLTSCSDVLFPKVFMFLRGHKLIASVFLATLPLHLHELTATVEWQCPFRL